VTTALAPADARAVIERANPALARVLSLVAPDDADLVRLAAVAALVPPPSLDGFPEVAALDAALVEAWAHPAPDTARAYAATLPPAARTMGRAAPAFWVPAYEDVGPIRRRRVGPYEAFAHLGRGGTGKALAAEHVGTGALVTLKLCAGAEGLVHDWFGGALPPAFLRTVEWGVSEETYGPQLWVAREPADETWADFLNRRRGAKLPLRGVLPIFALACEGVAALHTARVYQWSAHARNLFRVGPRWRLGDLGRCVVATSPDDPRFVAWTALDGRSPAERSALLTLIDAGPWYAEGTGGFTGRDGDREHRLRQDDCAMLGGLLVDLLGLNRWAVFLQAVTTRPLCSGRYDLTGNPKKDRALSRVLNRAWRGDAGGALALAAGGGDAYDDALELRADVADALRLPCPAPEGSASAA
jgi:hypothetical protein